ncbi:MAG: PAS domain-containing sensor histidine kinase [Pseudomonadota bacterium]
MEGRWMDLQALDYIPIPVLVLDRAGPERFEYVWMNSACAKFSNIRIDDIRGLTPIEAFPGRRGEQLAERQLAVARDAQPSVYEYPLHLGGREIWIETNLTPVCDAGGTVVRLVAMMQDRTEAHALAIEQAEASSALKNMESEIEQYISMAAHDLRTPMQNVSEIANMLLEDFVDHGDGKREMIELLAEIGSTASDLILDVLSFARASSLKSTSRPVDLNQLSSDIFAILDPTRKHDLTADDGLIETDPIALQITLRNLVDNSIKHSGGPIAAVHVGFAGSCNGMLRFRVRDKGRGFDDPAIAFLDSGEFKRDSGFGMLGIKRMITSRGGTIGAETPETGKGTLIRFSLPGQILDSSLNPVACSGKVPEPIRQSAAE